MCCVLVYRAIPTHTFVDYIRGGCQINLVVAIDFTVSTLCTCLCRCSVCMRCACMCVVSHPAPSLRELIIVIVQ